MKQWFDSIEKRMGSEFRKAFEKSVIKAVGVMLYILSLTEFFGAIAIAGVALFKQSPAFLLLLIPLAVAVAFTVFGIEFIDALEEERCRQNRRFI